MATSAPHSPTFRSRRLARAARRSPPTRGLQPSAVVKPSPAAKLRAVR